MSFIADIDGAMYALTNMDTPLSLKRLGAKLRDRRRARGMTQAQLAAHARLSRSVVIRAEQGDPTVAIGNVAKLLSFTGADLDAVTTRLPTLEEVAELFPDE